MYRAILVALVVSLSAAAQDRLYPFAIDQDHLTGAPDFSRLNHPLTPADRVLVKDGHFFTAGGDCDLHVVEAKDWHRCLSIAEVVRCLPRVKRRSSCRGVLRRGTSAPLG